METFNVKDRRFLDFNKFLNSKIESKDYIPHVYDRDKSGKSTKTDSLKEYQRTIKRDDVHKSNHYDSTYKAVTRDLVYKQEGLKPEKVNDPYKIGIPTVEVTNENKVLSFDEYLNVNEKKKVVIKDKEAKIKGKGVAEIHKEVKKARKKDAKIDESKTVSFENFINESSATKAKPVDKPEGKSTELKIDVTTLPKDGQEIVFQVYGEGELRGELPWYKGTYIANEQIFHITETNEFYYVFDVMQWIPVNK